MYRVLTVTLGLVATGAVLGALIGATSLWVATGVLGVGPALSWTDLLEAGSKAGALTGMTLAPISAWALMRRVPLGRAIGSTAVGALLGSLGGSIIASILDAGLAWSILGAPIGFLLAVAVLRTSAARRRPTEETLARVP
jgi:hypothetical protein